MPSSRRGAPHTVFLPPWFMLFLSRGGPPKPFILASYSHKDIKKKNQQKELLGMAVKCFIRKAGRGNRLTLYALAQQSYSGETPGTAGEPGHRGSQGLERRQPLGNLARTQLVPTPVQGVDGAPATAAKPVASGSKQFSPKSLLLCHCVQCSCFFFFFPNVGMFLRDSAWLPQVLCKLC